jgi:hypothetical protein
MTTSRRQGDPRALGGILFAAFFILGDVLRGVLANGPSPYPARPPWRPRATLPKARRRSWR